MQTIYELCSCKSGKKFKFCCHSKQITDFDTINDFPLFRCSVRYDWQKIGLAPIVVVRLQPSKNFIVAVYLVDIFALGIKDIIFKKNATKYQLDCLIGMQEIQCPSIPLGYEEARTLILGSIEYASKMGFNPHQDWNEAKYLVEPERPFKRNFTFGLNGKPFYYRGPNDKNIEDIVKKITAANGDYFIDIEE